MKDEKLSIGRVSKMVHLPSSVLRYWESVFDLLKPEKTRGGTRKYTMQDVEQILRIKGLLYKQKYTIAGAKIELQCEHPVKSEGKETALCEYIRKELESIINDLDSSINKINKSKSKKR